MNQYSEDEKVEKRTKLETLIKETKKERFIGYAKATLGVTGPLAMIVGITGIQNYFVETFGNPRLMGLIFFGIGYSIGTFGAPPYTLIL